MECRFHLRKKFIDQNVHQTEGDQSDTESDDNDSDQRNRP